MIGVDVIKENLAAVEHRIREALLLAGQSRDEIKLIVVTKTHPTKIIESLIHLGVSDIGESYVQEALNKQSEIRLPGPENKDMQWHMIGHVQSRKAALVAKHFDMLHSVDSIKLAGRLNRAAAELSIIFPVLIQVNVSGEQSKFGFNAVNEKDWNSLMNDLAEIMNFKNLKFQGLMSIPPFDSDEAIARLMYSKTRELRDRFQNQFPDHQWSELSMGMSSDFESAIKEGSTILRLGSVILGPRPRN